MPAGTVQPGFYAVTPVSGHRTFDLFFRMQKGLKCRLNLQIKKT